MKYYLIAGEASGDLHGSNLMKGLKEVDNNAHFRFWGGDMMQSVGGTLVQHYKGSAIMGFVEVLKKLGTISKNLKKCKEDILKSSPDVIILIDYPGFNFKIAEFAKKHGFRVFYYIAPKVWASRERRIKKLKKYVDKLFIIFPFEVPYFQKKGIDAIYEGNPLIDSIEQNPAIKESRQEFIKRYSLDDKPFIALLAGSRKGEISYLMPVFNQIADTLGERYNFLLAKAPSIEDEYYDRFITSKYITPLSGATYPILKHSVAAIIASGTASLEAALIGTPQIVGYGTSPITFWIAKQIVKLKYISLGNLIIDKLAFKELLQKDFNKESVLTELDNILNNNTYKQTMLSDYQAIRHALGGSGASKRVAQKMFSHLGTEAK